MIDSTRESHPKNCSGHYGGTCTCGIIPRKRTTEGSRNKVEPVTIRERLDALGFDSGDLDKDVHALINHFLEPSTHQ
jgi:hypothetical protein